MYVWIMRQCFGVGTSYGSGLGLTIPALGWDVTRGYKVLTSAKCTTVMIAELVVTSGLGSSLE
jgi:hypothetical protein